MDSHVKCDETFQLSVYMCEWAIATNNQLACIDKCRNNEDM